ncbi:hypothetical protein WP50_37795 [Lactiplantibacillus plantarum]|nr:hypothetical protein WP50_37795 [Lactiplantibacillus plantarum]
MGITKTIPDNNNVITADFIKYMQDDDDVNFIETEPAMTGEDFGYLIHQIPGTMFWLGVDSPYSLHSENMVPHTAAIMSGVNAMTGSFPTRHAFHHELTKRTALTRDSTFLSIKHAERCCNYWLVVTAQ